MQHNHQESQTARQYWVVINEEQELAVWPADRELPVGWQRTGKHGTRGECLAYIKLGRVARPSRKHSLAHEEAQ